MNIETHIRRQLWEAISSTYKTENYSHAILDAMHYLSDVLRKKSGTDGDGHSLVGKVLGGSSPILRVNKLQTESEKNIQRGLEQILRGLYQGIRNPRSHEQIEDTQETADAIIYFIDFLLGILDQTKEPFTIQGFLTRVFDPHFVHSARYAELLVEEILLNKRSDVLIEIYRRKREGEGKTLAYVIKEILKYLSEEQIADFLAIVSEELKVTQDDIDIRLTLQTLPPELWPKINEIARLRVENRLIESIKEGRVDNNGRIYNGLGALGTWAQDFLIYFDSRTNVGYYLLNKLEGDVWDQRYVFKFFLRMLPPILGSSYQKERCIKRLCQIAKEDDFQDDEDDKTFDTMLRSAFWGFPEDWRNSIKEILPDYEQSDEDIPF